MFIDAEAAALEPGRHRLADARAGTAGSPSPGRRRTTRSRCRRRSSGAPRAAPGCRARATRTAPPACPAVRDGELEQPAGERVDDDRVDRHDVDRGDRASWSAITIGRSSPAAATRSSTVCARVIRRRRKNDERVWTATRSMSSTTPSTSPDPVTTGKWRKPRSSMSSSTSPPSRSGGHVYAGDDIAAVTGSSPVRPAAMTRRAQVAVGEDPERPVARRARRPTSRRRRSSPAPRPGSSSPGRRRPAWRGSGCRPAGGRGHARERDRPGEVGGRVEQRAGDETQTRRAHDELAGDARRGSGSTRSARPREPRSRSAARTASTPGRTARPRRAGRARDRGGRSRPRRAHDRAGARPGRRPGRRSSRRRG